MLQFSVRALIVRLHELYSKIKPIAETAARTATSVTAAKNIIKDLSTNDSRFSIRVRHRDNDILTLSYFFSLMWTDLYLRHNKLDTVDGSTMEAIMVDGLSSALRSFHSSLTDYSNESSVNEVYDAFLKAGTLAYLDTKAPRWDDTLMRFFDKSYPHAITEAYVKRYHNVVTSCVSWSTVIRILLPKVTQDDINTQLRFIQTLAQDDVANKIVINKTRETRTNWYSYLPTAMFLASQGLTKSHNFTVPNIKRGQIVLKGVPSTIFAPTSYASVRKRVHQATFMPSPYLEKKILKELEEAQSREAKRKFELEERSKTIEERTT